MLLSKKVVALSAGALTIVSLAGFAQDPPAESAAREIVVSGQIDWVEKSDVATHKDGIIEHIEFEVGRRVKSGDEIGYLNSKMAELTEAKAKLAMTSTGEMLKAKAQRKLAMTELARLYNLDKKNLGLVPQADIEKGKAEVEVADAMVQVATEARELAKAEYEMAHQALLEHKILAPYPAVITARLKSRGEAVRAGDSVVTLGRTDRLRFVGWVPLETALRIKGNEVMDVVPVVEGSDLPLEKRKYRGKVTSVSREVNTLNTTGSRGPEVQIFGEIENPENPENPELELRQGMKAEMFIHLGQPAPDPKVASKSPR